MTADKAMTKEEFDKAMSALQDSENRPELLLGNDGGTYVRNRAARRRKPGKAHVVNVDYVIAPANIYTKSTHRIKKIRSKNVKRNEYRKRAATRAGKNSQEDSTQVS